MPVDYFVVVNENANKKTQTAEIQSAGTALMDCAINETGIGQFWCRFSDYHVNAGCGK